MKRNPAVMDPRGRFGRAELTAGHYRRPDVQGAQAVVDAALSGKGKLLGAGNFGASYKVVIDGVPFIVKIGSRETVHSRGAYGLAFIDPKTGKSYKPSYARMRTSKQAEASIIYEAAVANTLWAAGVRVVPDTVYAGHGALVREYGEIVPTGALTLAEYDALSLALADVVRRGWRVSDDLLLARRQDGTVYVADVGIWSKPKRRDSMDLSSDYSELFRLLRAVAPGAKLETYDPWTPRVDGPPSIAEVQHVKTTLAEYAREYRPASGDDADMKAFHRDSLRRMNERLRKLLDKRAGTL